MKPSVYLARARFQFSLASVLWFTLVVAVSAFGYREHRLRMHSEKFARQVVKLNDRLGKVLDQIEHGREMDRRQARGELVLELVEQYSGPPTSDP
jgi:hypothetical protein